MQNFLLGGIAPAPPQVRTWGKYCFFFDLLDKTLYKIAPVTGLNTRLKLHQDVKTFCILVAILFPDILCIIDTKHKPLLTFIM